MYNRAYTSDRISELMENEIFVFGSNLAGAHGGGAARLAYNRFGAVWGEGVGLHGKTYANNSSYERSSLELSRFPCRISPSDAEGRQG